MWWIVAAASAATSVDRSLDAPGEPTVSVSAPCGAIRISGSDRATVRVSGTVGDGQAFEAKIVDGRVTVHAAEDPAARAKECVDLTLEVPAGASLVLEGVSTSFTVEGIRADVDVETVSGEVTIAGARTVEAETMSSAIHVTGAAQRLELESVSGNVSAEGAGGTVHMTSVSGSIELLGSSPLTDTELTTVSGTITFRGALAPAGRLEASTHSGSLRMSLPADTDARLSQNTFSGQIHNAFGTDGELVLGAGKGRIELSTFSGDVDVERR